MAHLIPGVTTRGCFTGNNAPAHASAFDPRAALRRVTTRELERVRKARRRKGSSESFEDFAACSTLYLDVAEQFVAAAEEALRGEAPAARR